MSTTSNYLSLELSQQLHDAGVVVNSVFFWDKRPDVPECIIANNWTYRDKAGYLSEPKKAVQDCLSRGLMVPAPTATELAQWLEVKKDSLGTPEGTLNPVEFGFRWFEQKYNPFQRTRPEMWAEFILKLIEIKLIKIVKEAAK